MYREPQHPKWCHCRRCDARDLGDEMRTLGPLPVLDAPKVVAPVSTRPYTDLEADSLRELEERRRAYDGDPSEVGGRLR